MLTLLVFPPAMGLISPSPFSLKAIALMQMSGLEYETKAADPRKMPKKKLPVLIDGSKQIPDSSHIQTYLETQKGFDLDKNLSPQELAISQAFRCLIEDHLYWVGAYIRWVENADTTREEFFGAIPAPMRKFVFGSVKKQVVTALNYQGLGRHSSAEIHGFGIVDIKAVADFLGDKPFFLGDDANTIDASVFAALFNILVPSVKSPLKTELKTHANLLAYCDRFVERFNFPTV